MNKTEYVKFYAHGCLLVALGFVFSVFLVSVLVEPLNFAYLLVVGVIFSLLVPLMFGVMNMKLLKVFYKIEVKLKYRTIWFDGLIVVLFLLSVGYFLSEVGNVLNSQIFFISTNLITPLVYGYFTLNLLKMFYQSQSLSNLVSEKPTR